MKIFIVLICSFLFHATQGQGNKTTFTENDYHQVKAELLQILKDDQEPKKAFHSTQDEHKKDSIMKVGLVLEKQNLVKIEAILSNYGWLGPDQVGQEANSAIFLVIQHSDLAIQEEYLPLMRQAVAQGKAYPNQLALLEDRVSLRQGKKQIYGSQIGRDEKTGEFYVLPLTDPEHVDERRALVGLPPLNDYVRQWGFTWNVELHKKRKFPAGKKDWKF